MLNHELTPQSQWPNRKSFYFLLYWPREVESSAQLVTQGPDLSYSTCATGTHGYLHFCSRERNSWKVLAVKLFHPEVTLIHWPEFLPWSLPDFQDSGQCGESIDIWWALNSLCQFTISILKVRNWDSQTLTLLSEVSQIKSAEAWTLNASASIIYVA